MNKSIVIAIVFLGGCTSSSQVASLERQLRELQDANFALQQGQLDDVETDEPAAPTTEVAQASDDSTPEPAAVPAPVTRPMPDFSSAPAPGPRSVAMPAPGPVGPPQHWARAYRPPEVAGCDSGPLSVEIRNDTSWFLEVYLDGQQIRVFGAQGTLPHLPPGQSAYACLDHVGRHVLMGRAYQRRASELVQVDDFQITNTYGASPRDGRHIARLSPELFRWNPAPAH